MVSKRTQEMSSFIVMDVLERANQMERQGIHVIHLEVGEPDFDTPPCVKAAACKALDDGHTHYTHSLGLRELRETICHYYREHYDVAISADQVIVTSGTSPAMLLLFAALLDPGDQVIISDPHYACYPNFIRFVEGEPVCVPVFEEDGFQFRPDAIRQKITARTQAIFINSPSNPTGNLLSAERMEAIAGMSPYVISDEIYHGLVEIRSIAREPGYRTKIAVVSHDEKVDPVGACVGMRGGRIQAIVRELHDEKIDVIEWNIDSAQFIAKALSPARVSDMLLEEDIDTGRTATVLVPDDQLSLAIGREGQNARLAAKLTGWRIDIKSASIAESEKKPEPIAVAEKEVEAEALIQQVLEDKPEITTDALVQAVYRLKG